MTNTHASVAYGTITRPNKLDSSKPLPLHNLLAVTDSAVLHCEFTSPYCVSPLSPPCPPKASVIHAKSNLNMASPSQVSFVESTGCGYVSAASNANRFHTVHSLPSRARQLSAVAISSQIVAVGAASDAQVRFFDLRLFKIVQTLVPPATMKQVRSDERSEELVGRRRLGSIGRLSGRFARCLARRFGHCFGRRFGRR